MKNKIYIKHWLALKPQHYSSNTDFYYLKVANKINSNINTNPNTYSFLNEFLSKDDQLVFSCFLTCYFEDIISGINLWKTFKSCYKKFYNKNLPFYNTNETYIDDEINFEDVAFLTWYFLNTIQDNHFFSPHNDFILITAKLTMQILEEEYEYAPENKTLKKLYEFENKDGDFYISRALLQFVFFESYLFYTDIKYRMDLEILEIIENNKQENESPETVMSFIRESTEYFTFNANSALLGLNAKNWVENLLDNSHTNQKDIASISEKITGLFLYKKQDTHSVYIEYIASGMLFEMTKKSFDHCSELEEDDILFIGLVKYKDEWWFSGNFSISEFNADIILDQKNSADERSKVNFLNDYKEVQDILNKQEKAFLEYNGGTPIAYMNSEKVKDFVNRFMDYYNHSLKLSTKEKKEAKQHTKSDGYFGPDDSFENFNSEDAQAIVFFNPKNGVEIYFEKLINA